MRDITGTEICVFSSRSPFSPFLLLARRVEITIGDMSSPKLSSKTNRKILQIKEAHSFFRHPFLRMSIFLPDIPPKASIAFIMRTRALAFPSIVTES